ncbi:MAG: arginine decarboxylase, pyruvoyl-dependent [Oscillospiraceae bacterium]|nr:arginine decarboxylase, pyruvoyl-dependent [Oscillospiraceae bacterium]
MTKYIITKGLGNSKYDLNAFDNALVSSGIADFNLVKLSSILPANCHRAECIDLPKGAFLHTAYARYIETRPKQTISAAIAIAIPRDKSLSGVIMEMSGICSADIADETVCEMVEIAMETRGIKLYNIVKESVSMETKDGFNCVIAAVAIW